MSSMNKAKTRYFHGADIGSDNVMVLMTLQLKLKKNYNKNSYPKIKCNLDKLKDPEIADCLKATVKGIFAV